MISGYICTVSDAGSIGTGGKQRASTGMSTQLIAKESKMLMVLKNQLKKSRKKGFTLVEVIVVLVIIAVLAAIAIPALTGYIDKANEKAVISQTRSSVVAAQTVVSDAYGANKTITADWVKTNVTAGAIRGLSGDNSIQSVEKVKLSGPAIYQLKVVTTGNKSGYFLNGEYSTTSPSGFDASVGS
jgi:type IV pilus assembly protein PilA